MTTEELATHLQELGDPVSQEAAVRLRQLLEALKPYAWFARNVNSEGWTSNIHRESISTWFGPSNFRAAGQAYDGELEE